MDPARYLAEFGSDRAEADNGMCNLFSQFLLLRRHQRLGGAKLEAERNHLLLCAIVEVALETLPRVVRRGDDANTRGTEFSACFRVGDRGGNKVREVCDAQLGIRLEGFGPCRTDDQRTPDTAVDDDRRAYGGTQAV